MRLTIACCVLVLIMSSCSSTSEPAKPALTYPATTLGNVVEDYHGTKVADPYRWMENLDSPEVAAWVKAQNAVTDPYLASLPRRKALNERLTALWNYPRVGTPLLEGGHLFYRKNAGLQRQSPIYMRASADAPPALVIDPNVISEEGTVALSDYRPSPDARLARLWPVRRRRRLDDDQGARHRVGQGSVGRSPLDALLEHLVDERLQGLLLLALSGAAQGQGARGRALGSRAVLPPRRHAAVRGSARLRAQGSARLDHHRRGQRRRTVSVRLDVRRLGQQQSPVRRRPRRRRKRRT